MERVPGGDQALEGRLHVKLIYDPIIALNS
jgi:hypothetical protein